MLFYGLFTILSSYYAAQPNVVRQLEFSLSLGHLYSKELVLTSILQGQM